MSDTEKRPQSDFFRDSPRVRANPDTGHMSVPGVGDSSMVGVNREQFELKRREHAQRMAYLHRQINSTWQCLQCKRVFPGSKVRATVQTEHGVQMEVLKCPDMRCDGPVILHQDALSLTNPPKGAI